MNKINQICIIVFIKKLYLDALVFYSYRDIKSY